MASEIIFLFEDDINALMKLENANPDVRHREIKMAEHLMKICQSCSICMADFILNENVTFLPCTHLFHVQCIQEWFKVKFTCPICRIVFNGSEFSLKDEEYISNDDSSSEEDEDYASSTFSSDEEEEEYVASNHEMSEDENVSNNMECSINIVSNGNESGRNFNFAFDIETNIIDGLLFSSEYQLFIHNIEKTFPH